MQINTSISAYQTYTPQATANAGTNNSASAEVNATLNPVDSVEISSEALETPGERHLVPEPREPNEENGDG